ncbi:MAG: response regulator transcription factor [Gemmatimonadota bacterium]|nr:response regulator transcription factor [Gemmatimonadota bacterium]
MTRIAIVAPSAKLRASLVAALRASPAFQVVQASESDSDLSSLAEVVLVAQERDESVVPYEFARTDSVAGANLTPREREILALLADGLANKQIAARLGISKNTVKTHLELLFDKLGVSSRAEAVATGVRRGLLLL